jgi:hypothetical protein
MKSHEPKKEGGKRRVIKNQIQKRRKDNKTLSQKTKRVRKKL